MNWVSLAGVGVVSLAVGVAGGHIITDQNKKSRDRESLAEANADNERLGKSISILKQESEANRNEANTFRAMVEGVQKQAAASDNASRLKIKQLETQVASLLADNAGLKAIASKNASEVASKKSDADKEAADRAKRFEDHGRPVIFTANPKQGSFGYFSLKKALVVKVIEKDSAIVVLSYSSGTGALGQRPKMSTASRKVLIVGVDTTGIADGSQIELDMVFEVSGTEKIDGSTLLKLVAVKPKP